MKMLNYKPVIVACINGNLSSIKKFSKMEDFDVNHKSDDDVSLISYALYNNRLDVAEFLYEKGAKLHVLEDGRTIITKLETTDSMLFVLDRINENNVDDFMNIDYLEHAMMYLKNDLVDLFLKHELDVNSTNPYREYDDEGNVEYEEEANTILMNIVIGIYNSNSMFSSKNINKLLKHGAKISVENKSSKIYSVDLDVYNMLKDEENFIDFLKHNEEELRRFNREDLNEFLDSVL